MERRRDNNRQRKIKEASTMRIKISNNTDRHYSIDLIIKCTLRLVKYDKLEIDLNRDLANLEEFIKKLDIKCKEMEAEIILS